MFETSGRLKLSLFVATFVAVMVQASACIRYVPPRDEILSASNHEIGGEQQIRDFESARRVEKERFINSERTAGTDESTARGYHVAPGDLIDMQVFGVPDLSARVRVRPSGTISLPMLEDLYVQGLTEDALQSRIVEQLKRYVKTPRVKISIEEFGGHKVSVIGAVAHPGTYPMRRNGYTLLDVLSESGGRTERSGTAVLVIPAGREDAGGNESRGIEFDVEELYGNTGKPPLALRLLPGDTVVVPEAGNFEVTGDVKNPGAYPIVSRTSVMGAIAAAGGLEYSADVSKVELIRQLGEGKQAAISFNLEQAAVRDGKDFPLRNGDVVRVPSQEMRHAQRQIVEFLSGIFHVGYSGDLNH